MKAFSLALLGLLSLTACSQSFDLAPATPVAERPVAGGLGSDGKRLPPEPSSPFKGYAFSFASPLPAGWHVTSRGTNLGDDPIQAGYHPMCVVSKDGTRERMLFLLEAYMTQEKRIEDAAHMSDNDWWAARIPGSFYAGYNKGEDIGLRLATGNFPGADDIQLFTVLLCDQDDCQEARDESDAFANDLKIHVVRKDDMRVFAPGEQDCGSFF